MIEQTENRSDSELPRHKYNLNTDNQILNYTNNVY